MIAKPALLDQSAAMANRNGVYTPGEGQNPGPPVSGDVTVGFRTYMADAQIDPAWDALVENTLGGDLVQTTLWAATRQAIGARVWHLRLCGPDGAPAAGCLIQSRRVLPKLWIGTVPRGPLMFIDEPTLVPRLIREMISAARQAGIFLLVVQPPEGASGGLHAAMHEAGFCMGGPHLAPGATIRIPLQRSEAEILRSAHQRRRAQIRNAMRHGLECHSSDDIETFHRLHLASARRLGFAPISIANLRAQWEILAPKGLCQLIEVRYDGVPVGAEWLTYFGGTVTSKLRGRDVSGIPASPASKLTATASLWASISWARSMRARYFDFGGFDRSAARTVLSGKRLPENTQPSSRIKWSFGGEVILLPQPHFVFTNRLAHRMLSRLVSPLLSGEAARQLGQRIRAAR